MCDDSASTPAGVGTIAEGIPYPSVRAQYPDSHDRYDLLVTHLRDRLDAVVTYHGHDEGAFHLRIERSLEAIPDLDAHPGSHPGDVAVAWPPDAPPIDVGPPEGTLAVAAAYGFVVTGLQIRGTTHPSIAGTDGCPLEHEREATPALEADHPTIVVDVALADVTADGFRALCRRDPRIPPC